MKNTVNERWVIVSILEIALGPPSHGSWDVFCGFGFHDFSFASSNVPHALHQVAHREPWCANRFPPLRWFLHLQRRFPFSSVPFQGRYTRNAQPSCQSTRTVVEKLCTRESPPGRCPTHQAMRGQPMVASRRSRSRSRGRSRSRSRGRGRGRSRSRSEDRQKRRRRRSRSSSSSSEGSMSAARRREERRCVGTRATSPEIRKQDFMKQPIGPTEARYKEQPSPPAPSRRGAQRFGEIRRSCQKPNFLVQH